MAQTLSIKQGASLQLLMQATNPDGSPFPLANVVVTSQVRNEINQLIDTLAITATATPGQLSVLQSTSTWPTGTLRLDFKFVSGNVVLYSDTLSLKVDAPVTV